MRNVPSPYNEALVIDQICSARPPPASHLPNFNASNFLSSYGNQDCFLLLNNIFITIKLTSGTTERMKLERGSFLLHQCRHSFIQFWGVIVFINEITKTPAHTYYSQQLWFKKSNTACKAAFSLVLSTVREQWFFFKKIFITKRFSNWNKLYRLTVYVL